MAEESRPRSTWKGAAVREPLDLLWSNDLPDKPPASQRKKCLARTKRSFLRLRQKLGVLERQSEENQQRRTMLYSGRPSDWNSVFESDIQDRTTSEIR